MPITTVPYTQVYGPLSLPGVTCSLWLDGADTNATANITSGTWLDKSINSYHASSNAGGSPFSMGTINGLSAVTFPAASSAAFLPNAALTLSGIVGYNVFFVANTTGVGSGGTRIFSSSSSGSLQFYFIGGSLPVVAGIYDNGANLNISTFNIQSNVPFIYSASLSSTAISHWKNGSSAGSIAGSSAVHTSFYIGNLYEPGSTYAFTGQIGEFLIFSGTLTTLQRQQIEGYLAQKWGLTSQLPPGHPGYSRALYATGAYQAVIPFTLTPNQTQIPGFTKTPFNTIINRNLGGVSYFNVGQSYWNSFYQPYLETLVLANSAATHSTVTTITPSSPTGFTATLAPNGNLYIYPWNGSVQITVLTISTGALNYITGTGINNAATYYNSCLGPDGNIYYAPYNTAYVGVLYPSPTGGTFSISAITGTNSQTNGAYCGIVLAPNGKMYCVPRSPPWGGATSVGIIDPIEKTFTLMPNSLVATGRGYIGGVLAPNGKIYCIPFGDSLATSVGIIDPMANTFTLMPNSSVTTLEANTGGVLAPNGKIYCCAMNATYIGIIDPVANTFNSTSITGAPGSTSYGDGCLGPNGKIYLPPRNGVTFGVIDPVAGTLTTGVLSGSEFAVSILGSDGKIYLPSATSSKIGVLSFSGVAQLPDLKFCLSAYYNKT